MSKMRKKLERDVEKFLASGGKIKTEPTIKHTVASVKETYRDKPNTFVDFALEGVKHDTD